jgi:polysaccharide export outer membrane protein
MSIARIRFLSLVAVLTLPLPAAAQAMTDARPAAASRDTLADALRPGDVVRLRVWREADLTGEFAVDETGLVVLPKIGPMQVTADAPTVVKSKIIASYSKFLSHTAIDVTFLRRIQVLGAVRQPGVYPVDPTMTISDVLAVAGGTTKDGDPEHLELKRDGKRISGAISDKSLISDSRVRSGDQIYVPERSWIRRKSGFLIGVAISAAVTAVVTRAIRH